MLFREIIAVYSRNYTKRVNKLCGQNTGYMYVQLRFNSGVIITA
jgi:hypothetical protein